MRDHKWLPWILVLGLLGKDLFHVDRQALQRFRNQNSTIEVNDDTTRNNNRNSNTTTTTTTTTRDFYRERPMGYDDTFPNQKFHSKARFFIFVGLEGTGHHSTQALAKPSPSYKIAFNLKNFTNDLTELHYSLLNFRQGGVMNVHCASNLGIGQGPNTTAKRVDKWDPKVQNDDLNHHIQQVANVLKRIDTKVASHPWVKRMPIPVNAFGNLTLSFPSFYGHCRTHNYPNVDLLYKACAVAKVDCAHILLYRNPYGIIHSTTQKREFNPSVLGAIRLYTNLLSVLTNQLLLNPERNEGCIGFFETDQYQKNHMKDRLAELFHWEIDTNETSKELFLATLNATIRPPLEYTQALQDEIVSPKYSEEMETLMKLHHNLVKLCYDQYEQNPMRLMDP